MSGQLTVLVTCCLADEACNIYESLDHGCLRMLFVDIVVLNTKCDTSFAVVVRHHDVTIFLYKMCKVTLGIRKNGPSVQDQVAIVPPSYRSQTTEEFEPILCP